MSLFQSVIKQNVTEKALLQHYGEAVLVLDELLLAVSAPPLPPPPLPAPPRRPSQPQLLPPPAVVTVPGVPLCRPAAYARWTDTTGAAVAAAAVPCRASWTTRTRRWSARTLR